MDYTREFRKFITGQYLHSGIRITAGAVIPAVVLYHFDLLAAWMAMPLGALCVSLTDNPGPPHHRKNGLIASILINFVVAIITGFSRELPWLLGVEIVVFGMFFTLIGVYGTRISSIGLIALLVFIFNVDSHLQSHSIWWDALLFAAGGTWYAFLSMVLYNLRPFLHIQQLMGECLIDMSTYLRIKSGFYKLEPDYEHLNTELMRYQVLIQQHHTDLREMLFKSRQFVSESTTKSRTLMMMFLDSIDLLERVMTSQQDYTSLHEEFDNSDILEDYAWMIAALADELHEIGLAVQSGTASKSKNDLDALLKVTMDHFFELRKKYLNPNTIEGVIKLRQILYSIQDITERIKRLHAATAFDKRIARQFKVQEDVNQFVTRSELDPKILLANLSLKSASFRHAARVTVALMIGYIISLFFTLGHGYWILLTIVTIIKPAYSISRKRNLQRLAGTLIGGVVGMAILIYVHDRTAWLVFMLLAMIISYSFLKLQYLVASACITIYVLLSFAFLNPAGYEAVLHDRVLDTFIGSVVAFIVAQFVLPTWEQEQVTTLMLEALQNNRSYFDAAAECFTGKQPDVTTFKLVRKNAFVALANLSDNLQRMLSEPKDKRPKLKHYHQFVATSHMLTSHIAALSYYAQRNAAQYESQEFQPLVQQVDLQFRQSIELLQHHRSVEVLNVAAKLPISDKIQQLMDIRRKELESGGTEDDGAATRKTLSDMKTITDSFELISTMTVDQLRIIQKLVSEQPDGDND
ncbi:TIGR01666 family membrane protein [Filimonas lacunae]|uniref:TIGR01666 family membrane protein n=1 Tax=Filimonas lacunae TaxID=477680 RepID=A0A1N7RF18_9BACT|nr:FUSC family membrane protein [Filimonas lacunae]SIT33277.1 TIGR01666 family membrane protein [Filimonas lacunae]